MEQENSLYQINNETDMKLLTKIRLRGKAAPHKLTYGEYCMLYAINAIANHRELTEKMPRPRRLAGRWMPEDLNGMSMGTLVEVLEQKEELKLLSVVYGISTSELEAERAENVIGAIRWTVKQLESITGLFSMLEREYTAEELAAGIETMKGDIFSTIDWYARRMGITDHDEVLKVSWIKIWRCAKDDRDAAEYSRRLQSIMNNKK